MSVKAPVNVDHLIWSKFNETGKDIVLKTSSGRDWRIAPKERIMLPKQIELMTSPGKARHIFFGGSLGGTKSYAMRWMAVRRLLQFAQRGFRGVPVALACETMPALRRRHVSEMQRLFPKWLGKYNVNEWKFKLAPQYGGGFIQLIGLDDAAKYASDQYADIYIDELTFNSEETYNTLSQRCRWPGIEDSAIVSASNPGRIGHSWVCDRFVNPKTRRPGHHFIQSLWSDNPFMPQSYWDDLIANMPEKVRKAMVDGDWTVFEGQYFTNLDEQIHYVPRRIYPKNWRRFRVIDWGYNHPCVCIWCTVSPDGVMYVYREHSVAHQTAEWHKRVIAEMSAGEEYDYTIVDPSLDRHDGSFAGNKTALEIFNDPNDGFGSFRCITADRDRIAGWHALLNAFEYELADDGFAFKVAPQVFITHDCPHVWSSLRSLVYDEHNIEDVQKTKKHVYGPGQGDDEADCVRYAWKYCLKSPEARQSPIILDNIQRVGVANDGGWKDNPFASKSPYARF